MWWPSREARVRGRIYSGSSFVSVGSTGVYIAVSKRKKSLPVIVGWVSGLSAMVLTLCLSLGGHTYRHQAAGKTQVCKVSMVWHVASLINALNHAWCEGDLQIS